LLMQLVCGDLASPHGLTPEKRPFIPAHGHIFDAGLKSRAQLSTGRPNDVETSAGQRVEKRSQLVWRHRRVALAA
jgi:hypothetical protein